MSDEFEHTGVIVPRFWDAFRGKAAEVKVLGVFLVTGRHNAGLPGCCVLGWAAIAEEIEVTPERLAELWAQLPADFAQYDRASRVLRVPNVPRYGHRPNHQVIRSWWRRWKSLPESPLKYAHVASLQESLPREPKDAVVQVWESTFGTIVIPATPIGEAMGDPMGGVTDSAMGGSTHPPPRSKSLSGSGSSPDPDTQASSATRTRVTPEPTTEARDVAAYLLEAIRSHSPDAKDGVKGWAKDIDLAIRVDKRTPEQLRCVIDFAHRSSELFWRPNVLSGAKLRDKFDQLTIQARSRASPTRDVRVGHVAVTGNETYAGGEVKL